MGQNYNSSCTAIALLLRQRSMSEGWLECWDAGRVIGALHLSLCPLIPLKPLRVCDSFFFSFFFTSLCYLVSCFAVSVSCCSTILPTFHCAVPGEMQVSYLATTCLDHSKNVWDVPLYFSSYHIILFSCLSVTVHPLFLCFHLSWPLYSPSPQSQHVSFFCVCSQT